APLQISLLCFSGRTGMPAALWTGLLLSPLVVGSSVLGVRLGDLLSRPGLRRMAYAILFLTAALSILAPAL
ncbi:MAG: hypothetical protein V1800_14320, partial [Candidatus Latescibacterota bacterium]